MLQHGQSAKRNAASGASSRAAKVKNVILFMGMVLGIAVVDERQGSRVDLTD
jgi:hypothetical protein